MPDGWVAVATSTECSTLNLNADEADAFWIRRRRAQSRDSSRLRRSSKRTQLPIFSIRSFLPTTPTTPTSAWGEG